MATLLIIWTWITAHWEPIVGVLSLLLSLVNAATPHWSGASGIGKVLSFLLELVSWLRSKDSPSGALGPLKFPGQSVPPTGSSSGAGGVLGVLLVASLLALDGCTATTLDAALVKGYGLITPLAVETISLVGKECGARAAACGTKTAKECSAWVACDSARTAIDKGMDALEGAIASLRNAYLAARSAGVIK